MGDKSGGHYRDWKDRYFGNNNPVKMLSTNLDSKEILGHNGNSGNS